MTVFEPQPRRPISPWALAPATFALSAVNAAVFLAVTLTGGFRGSVYSWFALERTPRCVTASEVLASLTPTPCASLNGVWYPGVDEGAWWRLITSAFTHVDLAHIGFNMLALYFLGTQFERGLGRAKYLAVYMVSALVGSFVVWWLSPPDTSTVGASGAIYGLLGVLLVYALRGRTALQPVLMWLGLNAVMSVLWANISWQGHLGGFIGGFAMGWVLVPGRPRVTRPGEWGPASGPPSTPPPA